MGLGGLLHRWDSTVCWGCIGTADVVVRGNHLPPIGDIGTIGLGIVIVGCYTSELTVEPFSPEHLLGMLVSGSCDGGDCIILELKESGCFLAGSTIV